MKSRSLPLCWTILFLAVTLPYPPFAFADDDLDYTDFTLDELMEMNVVYGASKIRQDTKEAPASVTIITREDIKTYGYRTMADVLGSLRGFYVTYDRSYHYVGVRGLGQPGDLSCRILVLVDGIRTNEGSVGGIMMGHGFPVDLELIERIEVIRGPASSLYGTNAVLGIINVVTREGYTMNGVEVQGTVSSFGGRSLRLTGGYETPSGVDLLLTGSIGQVDGQDYYIEEFDYPEYNDGVSEDRDREEWNSMLAKILYKDLSFDAMYGWRLKQNPMAPSNTTIKNNSAQTQDTSWRLGLGYKRKLPWDVDLSTQFIYQHFKWDGEWYFDYDYEGNWVAETVPYVDIFRGEKLTGVMDMTKHLPGDHVVAIGADYINHTQMDMSARDLDPYFLWFNSQQSPENWGIYGLTVLKVLPGFQLNLGVRYDEYTTFGGSTNPRFALITEPRAGTVLKALYGTAFRAPNGYEISSEDAQGRVKYTPEEIETYELILEQKLGAGLSATLTGYFDEYRTLTDAEFDQSNQAPEEWVNDEVESSGIEFELARKSRNGLSGRFSYSYNKTEERLYNPLQANSHGYPHMVKLGASIPVPGLLGRIGLEYRYYGKRLTIKRNWADNYHLMNLNVWNPSLVDGLEVRASVYNLLNESIPHPGTWGEYQDLIWQDGRSFRLSVTLSH